MKQNLQKPKTLQYLEEKYHKIYVEKVPYEEEVYDAKLMQT